MSTNSVVIKTGIFTEWFQPHLIPCVPHPWLSAGQAYEPRWFMYIPSKLDFSDLADILALYVHAHTAHAMDTLLTRPTASEARQTSPNLPLTRLPRQSP